MKIATGLLLCTFAGGAMAAEIRVLSAGAVEPGLRAAAAAFKKQSGHDVNIAFNTAPEIRKRIGGGEAFDVVIADRKSTRLNSSHDQISYAVFCLKKKKKQTAKRACAT